MNTEGNSYSTGWRNINNTWYNFGSDGYMRTGWINDNGAWYYLDNSGAMKTGWVNPGNVWYYLDQSAAMKTGWFNSNGTWYYTNENGAMQTGFLTLGTNQYYLNENGAMVTGDITINGVKYTFAQSGEKLSSLSAAVDTTTGSAVTANAADEKNSTIHSNGGGSGSGSSGSSSSSSSSTFKGYSDLYGNWKVDSHIENSGLQDSLSGWLANSLVDQTFTVNKDGVHSDLKDISKVQTSETVLTNSQFKEKFGTDISKIGLSGNKVNCITVSDGKQEANIIVSSDNKVVAIAKDTAFKLKKN